MGFKNFRYKSKRYKIIDVSLSTWHHYKDIKLSAAEVCLQNEITHIALKMH